MKRAALGLRMHSGWGVLVAVSAEANAVEVLDRRRIVIIDPQLPGAKQPYHYAASLDLPASEKCLVEYAASSERFAETALREVVAELDARHYRVVGSAVLLASGRSLPPLPKILASHPLIHTAEGEFFRSAVRAACERLQIPVLAVKERELPELAKTVLGSKASQVLLKIANLGSSLGPPWTQDHKTAALAAFLILARAE
ncbi:MAG: hypothetical protein WBW33_23645 [Bryobacteraceae bacterium]